MKRTIFFLLAVMSMMVAKAECPFSSNGVADESDDETMIMVGAVTISGKKRNVYVLTSSDSTQVRAVVLNPTSHFSKFYDFHNKDIVFPYTNENWRKLKEISDKYNEWSKVAKENNVGHMEKDVDISIDDLYVHLYETSRGKITKEYNISLEKKKFAFLVPATIGKEPILRIELRGKDRSKDSRYFSGSLTFDNCNEFEEFINFIQPDSLKCRLTSKTIDKLFK